MHFSFQIILRRFKNGIFAIVEGIPVKKLLLLFLLWKALVLLSAIIAPAFLALNERSWLGLYHVYRPLPYLAWIWINFDGGSYIDIARYNYHYPNFAFFPLFPLITAAINQLTGLRNSYAALIVSNASLLLSLFVVYKITLLDYKKSVALATVVLLLAFPFSLFYGVAYADSLYLLLATLSFYHGRKARWLWAGFFGFLAGLDRLIGAALLPVLLLEWFMQNKPQLFTHALKLFFRQKVFFLFLIPLALVAYGSYLQIYHGDFLLFQKSMHDWSQDKFVFPPQVAFRYIKIFLAGPWTIAYFIAILEFVTTIIYFSLSIYVFKKIRPSYGLFMFLTFLVPTFTGTFQSMPRYILHVFPGFIAIALLTSRSEKIFRITVLIFLILEFIFVALFTRGYFVA